VLAEQDNPTGYAIYAAGAQNYFSGSVGIGTTTPTASLDVQGNANFTGPVRLAPQGDLDMGGFTADPASVADTSDAVAVPASAASGAASFSTGATTANRLAAPPLRHNLQPSGTSNPAAH
jgi:hypothetical protein